MKPPSRTPADPGKALISLVALAMERFNASDSTEPGALTGATPANFQSTPTVPMTCGAPVLLLRNNNRAQGMPRCQAAVPSGFVFFRVSEAAPAHARFRTIQVHGLIRPITADSIHSPGDFAGVPQP